MRRFGWTSLVAALIAVAVWIMTPVAAVASPGGVQTNAMLRFALDPGSAISQPFDRWLRELSEMTALFIESGVWEEGEAMRITVCVAGREAGQVSLIADGENVSMESSLMADGSVRLRVEDSVEARALMDGLRKAASGPRDLALTAAQFAGLLRGAEETLTRWSRAAEDTEGEICAALADFLGALKDIADSAGEAVWLKVSVEEEAGEPEALTVMPGECPAPEELPAILAVEGFWSVMRAIAAG
jgi:hypothetical protein